MIPKKSIPVTQNFSDLFQRECIEGSAIDRHLYRASVEIVEDTGFWEPNRALAHHVSRFHQTRKPHNFGAIALFKNEDGSYWQGKPENPRIDPKKVQPNKYEAILGNGSRAFLPSIPPEIRQLIGERYGGDVPVDGSFWSWYAAHPELEIPLILTEGGKKALALLSQGYVAIALYGVNGGYRNIEGIRSLIPDLERFVQPGRTIVLAFDQDEKAATRRRVAVALHRFGWLLKGAEGVVRVARWDGKQGKGVDDLIVRCGAAAAAAAIDEAVSFESWERSHQASAHSKKPAAQRFSDLLTAEKILSVAPPTATVTSEGSYLTALPPLSPGSVHWICAQMGVGKTTAIGRDWVAPWIASGGCVGVLSPLNSLGKQTAEAWKLPHVHHYFSGEGDRILGSDASLRGGVVGCLNSAHRIAAALPDRPLLLILDEAAQVLSDAALGGTLRGKWSNRWEAAIGLMRRAVESGGAIILSESGIGTDTIRLVEKLSGADVSRTVGIRHHKTDALPWQVEFCRQTSLSGWRSTMMERIKSGDRILCTTTSQRSARILEAVAVDAGIHVIRIDSDTNEEGRFESFFEDPDAWLRTHNPQLLILSPSCKTGISIEGTQNTETAYFSSVWGFFPALDIDTQMQLLGRYRPSVPRYVWSPAFISPDTDENADGGRRSLQKFATQYNSAIGGGGGGGGGFGMQTEEDEILGFLAARRARKWAQKIAAADELAARLTDAGHQVTVHRGRDESMGEMGGEGYPSNKEFQKLWDKKIEDLARWDAKSHAEILLDPSIHTPKWARQILNGDSTAALRAIARKVLLIEKFPGLNWDDSDLWYAAEFAPKAAIGRGAALWAEADHYRELWQTDKTEAIAILGERLRAVHHLPGRALQAGLASIFKSLVEQLLNARSIVPGGAAESEIKKLALIHAEELRRFWRLDIQDTQTPEAIAAKIARKFGLQSDRSKKISYQGAQRWEYSIRGNSVWEALTWARNQALSARTDLFLGALNKFVLPSLQISPPPASPPPASPPPASPPLLMQI